jgi:hypothetical protein
MGIISKGILGGFSGTVGTVIGGSWKGISYMRSKPAPVTREPSLPQLAQQLRFSAAVRFVQTLTPLVHTSFKSYAVKMTGFNNAVSYNMKNALTGTYPDYKVNYSLALVCRGDLPNAQAPAATATGSIVYYTWTPNDGVGKAGPDDRAILVVYCPARMQCIYTIAAADRSAAAGSIEVPSFAGQKVHTWIGFLSANGRDVSNSIYTGEIQMAP